MSEKNYVAYHTHSDLSLLDSCTQYQQYMDLAVEQGMKAISISEHGRPSNWTEKMLYAKGKGLKYIHSCEIYLTESLEEKVRDNYHCVCLCKNHDGFIELNNLISKGGNSDHFYYVPRISFEEFMEMSDNIITTSACLASALNKLDESNPWFEELVRKFTYLEIQPHNVQDQKDYNRKLVELSIKFGKPLIAATDAHSLNKYKDECRDILMLAKHKYYGDEGFDLTWKSYDELVEAFRIQNAVDEAIYMEAIENTNRMAEQTDELEIDPEFKYPILNGTRERDDEEFEKNVWVMFDEKIKNKVIPEEQVDAYRTALTDEIEVLRKLKMGGFMLSMSDLIHWAKEQGMAIGPSRGSVGGSRVAYVTDITDLPSETFHTSFYRFANPDRLEPGDIDIDCIESDRPKIFEYIINKFGTEKTARVSAYGTLQSKAVIDEIARALDTIYKANRVKQFYPDLTYQEINNQNKLNALFDKYCAGETSPWNLKATARVKEEFEKDPESTRLAYKDLFYYFDGLMGTRVSQSVHPAGMVISSERLDDYCTFINDGERCLVLDMDNAHDANLIKYDLLILKTVKIIDDACKMAGIPYPKAHLTNFKDDKVWLSMITSPVGLFQFESSFAFDSLRKFQPHSIEDVTLVTAAIRPSGASYRDRLLARQPETGWPDQINEILKDNYYYLVYQEDILKILMQACGLNGGEADTVRRGIAKKKEEILAGAMPKILEGYCSHSSKSREEAEIEAKNLLQVIQDASAYMFGYNHAVGYSLLTYYCACLRYYYPLEFLTAYLNNAANDDDIKNGTEYAQRVGVTITMPKWGVSKSDYYFDKDKKMISKGLSSIKSISDATASQLYGLSQRKQYTKFVDMLRDMLKYTKVQTNQLDVLIKIDFFSDFGNQRELLYIVDMFYNTFKKGEAKKINKKKVDGTDLEPIIRKYAIGTTKDGSEAASWTLCDINSIMDEAEDMIKAKKMDDLSVVEKVKNFKDVMGYAGYVSGREEDRRKLMIEAVKPLMRKKDGKQFGYSYFTRSIGSGISSRFTILNNLYNKIPIKDGDIIFCEQFHREGQYFNMDFYTKIS